MSRHSVRAIGRLGCPAALVAGIVVFVALSGVFGGCDSGSPPARPQIVAGNSPPVPAGDLAQPAEPPPAAPASASGPKAPPGFPVAQPAPAAPAAPLARAQPMTPLYDAINSRMNIAGCGRDVVGFSFDVVAPSGGLSNVRVAVGDLELVEPRGQSRIVGQSMELFRVLPIKVVNLPAWYQLYEPDAVNRRAGEFPDALVPADNARHGQPWRLAGGEKLSLWLDVPIPADTAPGTYEGRLSIMSDNGPASGFTIRLQVLPLNLPEDPGLRLLCPLDVKQMLASELGEPGELSDANALGTNRELTARRLAQWIELGRRHGVQFLPADLSPIFKRTAEGRVVVDWDGYDAVVGPALSGPGSPPVAIAPFTLDNPSPELYGGLAGEEYLRIAGQHLKAIGEHWIEKKWPKPLVWLHRASPGKDTLAYGCWHWRDWLSERWQREATIVSDLVWRAELDFGYLDPLPWAMRKSGRAGGPQSQPETTPGRLVVPSRLVPAHVSVYCPPAQFLDPATLPNLRSEGLSLWLGEGGPPWRPSAEIFAHPEQLEALAYLGHRYGIDTVWLASGRRWPTRSPLAAPLSGGDAGFLFYCGQWFQQDRPVASLRLKHLRQAVQDAAMLKLLGELHRRTPADAIAGAMVKHAMGDSAGVVPGLGGPIGWQQEPVFYADARMMLREELLRAAGRAGDPASADARSRFLWLQFHERTAWLRLEAGPGQLVDQLTAQGAPSGQLRAVLRFWPYVDPAVCNPTRPGEPIGLVRWPTLAFGALPATWTASRHNLAIEQPPPSAILPVALAMDGRELRLDKTSRMAVPLVVRGETGHELTAPRASLPVLPGHAFRQPPRIDGRLDDWPTANWYRGAGFARLAMAAPASLFSQQPPPPLDSYFQAGYDDRNLYLAIVCMGQKPTDIVARYANNVRLDHGLVIDEDAVQVVLDPTGGRLDRQGLLHLLVKPTGTVLGWRGMTGPGGTGWPPEWGRTVRAEVSFQPTYWMIELAIPRDELGQANPAGLWRINVIRHVAAIGEHSAWASSCPMIGEPETLGNLLLRPPPLPNRDIPLIPVSPLD